MDKDFVFVETPTSSTAKNSTEFNQEGAVSSTHITNGLQGKWLSMLTIEIDDLPKDWNNVCSSARALDGLRCWIWT